MLQKPKKKLLAWSDSAATGTGFGTVSRHVLGALHSTGEWEIHHLAINANGDFKQEEQVPWTMVPAKLMDPGDPHGMKMFGRSLMRDDYDAVWICNDLYVTKEVIGMCNEIKQKKGSQFPHFVYYYPVDCHAPSNGSMMVEFADTPVCYTKHGREETITTLPHVENKLIEIPHGVDSSSFYPLKEEEIIHLKKKMFGADPETYVIVNVNRNSQRKQIPYSLLAFKEFKKHVPNSMMYIHTAVKDQGGDILRAIDELGMNTKTDVVYPVNYSPGNPVGIEALNKLYNCGDLFLTTHLGEGWGLTITEAMAAGVPVVAPDNTCMPQQLGEDGERGYLYPCKDLAYIDTSGYRKKGNLPDVVSSMLEAYNDGAKKGNPKTKAARAWAVQHDWKKVTEKWVELFQNLKLNSNSNSSVEVL